MAQPQPGDPDPLVQEGREPPRPPPARQRHDRLQASTRRTHSNRPTGLGSKERSLCSALVVALRTPDDLQRTQPHRQRLVLVGER